MLIPNAANVLIGRNVEVVTAREQPMRTYKVDFSGKRVIGFADGIEAMKQAIFKILETERFDYLIYSRSYGIELSALFGKSWPVVSSEIKRVLREALLADSRIDSVSDITVIRTDKRTVAVSFTASTRFGDIPIERGITLHV